MDKQDIVSIDTNALHLLRGEGYEMETFDAGFIKKAQKSGHLASSP